MKKDQLTLDLTKQHSQAPEITLPDTQLDLIEQFAFALQNRDAIGLDQLIYEQHQNRNWGNKYDFIKKFTEHCNKLEDKHGAIYVHTVPGHCEGQRCQLGSGGLAVTVSTVANNQLLWAFNLVFREAKGQTLNIWRCRQFSVDYKDIPF